MQERADGGRFQRKGVPQAAQSKPAPKEEIYNTLMSKIRAKLVNSEVGTSKDEVVQTGKQSAKKIGLVDGTLRSINKSLLSRLSQQRGKLTDSSDGSMAQANQSRSKAESKPAEAKQQHRLKILEREIKELDSLRTYAKKEPANSGVLKGTLSILEKFKQSPVRKRVQPVMPAGQPEDKLNSSQKVKTETPGDRIRLGLESLKARVAQMPSQQNTSKPSEEEIGQPKGIDINLYKRKVEKRSNQRDKEASLKVMQARRADEGSVGRKNLTHTFTEKLRASRIAQSSGDY